MYADGVFEGGGVKGIGLVGAVCCLEDNGYKWMNLAGTSSGSIVAALLSAGYTGKELKDILYNLDYASLLDKDLMRIISIPTMDVKTKEFNISKEKSKKLFESGYNSAKKFLEGWSFETYVKKYGAIKKV